MNRLPDLTCKTVLVVGGAPCDITGVVADYVIAASSGIKNAPHADMLVTIDGVLPEHSAGADEGFNGVRVVGVPSAKTTDIYIPLPYERVQMSPTKIVEVRNNGISAIRIAADRGAKSISLAGFDTTAYDAFNAVHGYAGVTSKALPALIAELASRGVSVSVASPQVVKSPRNKRLLDSKRPLV